SVTRTRPGRSREAAVVVVMCDPTLGRDRSVRRPAAWACQPSTYEAEERPELVHEEVRLLEGGEVAAPLQLVPVTQVGEALLGPAPGEPDDLLGKDGAPGRDRDGAQIDVAVALPVEAGRR